ncbi:MAG: hypothetical protein D6765_04570, partial [Bacteroidetes bacterium]
PHTPPPDGWHIAGCPVNGPALAARDSLLGLAWFTRAEDRPRVQLLLSRDGGQTFGPPLLLDEDKPQGRVDLVFNEKGNAVASWMSITAEEEATIFLAEVSPEGRLLRRSPVTTTSPARSSGFPVLKKWKDGYLLARTVVAEGSTTVSTALLKW